MKTALLTFFHRNPALLVALFFLLGLALSIRVDPVLLFLTTFLLCLFVKKIKIILFLTLIPLLAFFYGKHAAVSFPKDTVCLYGEASVHLDDIKESKTHFKTGHLFKGLLHMKEKKAHNIPCFFTIPPSLHPLTATEYLIYGTLEKTEKGFCFTPDKEKTWQPIKSYFCLAKYRFEIKAFLAKQIKKIYSRQDVSNLLVALTIGDLSDPLLKFSFGRLGLQHILAISGFHFGLLALFFGTVFRLFLSPKKATIGLIFCLTGYFFLLSGSPSITRAYLAILLYLGGRLLKRQTRSLNIFGAVLLLELLLEPRSLQNLGFQLSFLATAAILWLYPLLFSWTEKLFPHRSSQEIALFPKKDLWAYLFCCFLKSAFALNIAVHLATVPVCLYYFQRFPVASLVYNIFVPFCICISLFLFLSSLPFFFLCPPIGFLITTVNQGFTASLLRLIKEAPNQLNWYITTPVFSPSLLFFCLLFVFCIPFFYRLKGNLRWIFT